METVKGFKIEFDISLETIEETAPTLGFPQAEQNFIDLEFWSLLEKKANCPVSSSLRFLQYHLHGPEKRGQRSPSVKSKGIHSVPNIQTFHDGGYSSITSSFGGEELDGQTRPKR